MSESITLEINAEGDWDGSTEVELNRDNAVVTSRRYYKFNLNGPHGVLRADLGGLFSPVSMKLVGVGYSSWNPESKGRIIASDATGSFRQEITLKPAMQFVVMYPGDKLAFSTQDERGQLVLVVNELNEAEAVKWGLGHQPFVMPTRFRIIRHTGAAFVPNPTTTWQPDFGYDPNSGVLVASDDGSGAIPASSLCLYPRWQGCYVSARFAGSDGVGRLRIVDNLTRNSWQVPGTPEDVRWSAAAYISHDDLIALEAAPAVPGEMMVCDIEVSLVFPGNRLAGRYQEGT
jgi:hypothetical protein